jgi:hypothetical protein
VAIYKVVFGFLCFKRTNPTVMSTNDLAAAKKRALATYAAFCNKSGVFPRTKKILDELATHQCEVAEKAKDKELEVKDFDPYRIANKMQSALELDVEDWLSARHEHELAQKECSRLKEAAEAGSSGQKAQEPAKKKAKQ